MFEPEFERCFNLQYEYKEEREICERHFSIHSQITQAVHIRQKQHMSNYNRWQYISTISSERTQWESGGKKPQDCNLCYAHCVVINSLMQFDCCDHQVAKLISIDKLHTTNGYGLMNRARDAYWKCMKCTLTIRL